jgi:predicted transcriptional regulator
MEISTREKLVSSGKSTLEISYIFEQQEDIEAKQFLSKKDFNNSNLALETRRRNNTKNIFENIEENIEEKKLKILQNICARIHLESKDK